MTSNKTRRIVVAAAWTVLLAFALHRLDRALLSSPAPPGWVAAPTLDDIPSAAGRIATPAYLPSRLEWPPRELRYRTGAHPGWWLGVHESGGIAPALWIGTGDAPLPEVIEPEPACVYATPHAHCRGGWHSLSKQLPDGQVVFVLTTLPPVEAARILKGIHTAEIPARHRPRY